MGQATTTFRGHCGVALLLAALDRLGRKILRSDHEKQKSRHRSRDDCYRREGVTPPSWVGVDRDDLLMIADEVIAELTAPPFRRYDDLAARSPRRRR